MGSKFHRSMGRASQMTVRGGPSCHMTPGACTCGLVVFSNNEKCPCISSPKCNKTHYVCPYSLPKKQTHLNALLLLLLLLFRLLLLLLFGSWHTAFCGIAASFWNRENICIETIEIFIKMTNICPILIWLLIYCTAFKFNTVKHSFTHLLERMQLNMNKQISRIQKTHHFIVSVAANTVHLLFKVQKMSLPFSISAFHLLRPHLPFSISLDKLLLPIALRLN